MIDTQEIHPLTDFLRNHETHIARIKETHTPEVLTVDGRAELVLLDTESYEALMERLYDTEEITVIRGILTRAKQTRDEPIPAEEFDRRARVVDELTAETERLGLYRWTIAVLDANVLYPPSLRDLLMRLAAVGAYEPRLTEEIHAEWMRNVLANSPSVTPSQLDRTRRLMNQVTSKCLVAGYEMHLSSLTLDLTLQVKAWLNTEAHESRLLPANL